MKIKVLGSGSAFTQTNWHSNYLIDDECSPVTEMREGVRRQRFLIDCGSDIRFSLKEAGLSYKDIDMVYISHLHADHCGGLEYLAFCSYFDPKKNKIKLLGETHLLKDLWSNTLSGGLASVEGSEMFLEDYFKLCPVKVNKDCLIGNVLFNLVQQVHVMNGYSIVPSFGMMFKTSSKTVYFTTDTQFAPEQLICFYKQADLIIHDCETAPYESKVHAHYNKLKTLPSEIKAKMWLTHYQDGDLPDAKAEGFLGFLKKGQEIEI